MPSVYLVAPNKRAYEDMFIKEGWTIASSIRDADLVQFTGGDDIDPSIYGEEKHPLTNIDLVRGSQELDAYIACVEMGKPRAGICRGGQFLHVMNGGYLFQHTNNHMVHGTHRVLNMQTGDVLRVTSMHHQSMRMSSRGTLLLKANESTVKEYMHKDNVTKIYNKHAADVEACYYEATRSFCFQPHPEYDGGMDTRIYYFEQLSKLFNLSA